MIIQKRLLKLGSDTQIINISKYNFVKETQKVRQSSLQPSLQTKQKKIIGDEVCKIFKSSLFLQNNLSIVFATNTISLYDILRVKSWDIQELRKYNQLHIQSLKKIVLDLRVPPPIIPFQNWESLITKPFLLSPSNYYLLGKYTKNIEQKIDDALRSFNEIQIVQQDLRKIFTEMRDSLSPFSNRLLEKPHYAILETKFNSLFERFTKQNPPKADNQNK